LDGKLLFSSRFHLNLPQETVLTRTLRLCFLLLGALVLSASGVKADTLAYDLNVFGSDINFNLAQTPGFSTTSFGYAVPISGLNIYGTTVHNIDFYTTAHGGGLSFDGNPQLTGAQLFTYSGGVLTLSTGNFSLVAYGYYPLSLAVTDTSGKPSPTPEPATLSLLVAGLAGLGLLRKRHQPQN
jgi:hypothetical protein